MIQFTCQSCARKWFAPEDIWEDSTVCPYCSEALPLLQVEAEKQVLDPIERVIFEIINERGKDILNNRPTFYSLMMDLAPNMQKEIGIMRNNCDDWILSKLLECFDDDVNSIKRTTDYISFRLENDNGLSEEWAHKISLAFFNSICRIKNCCKKIIDPLCYNISQEKHSPQLGDLRPVKKPGVIKKIDTVYPEIIGDRILCSSFPQWYSRQVENGKVINALIIDDEERPIIESGTSNAFDGWIIIGSKTKRITSGAFIRFKGRLIYISSDVEYIEKSSFSFSAEERVIIVLEHNAYRIIEDGAFYPTHNLILAYEEIGSSFASDYCSQNKIPKKLFTSFEEYFVELSKYITRDEKEGE